MDTLIIFIPGAGAAFGLIVVLKLVNPLARFGGSVRQTLESPARVPGAQRVEFDFKHTGLDDIRRIDIHKNREGIKN